MTSKNASIPPCQRWTLFHFHLNLSWIRDFLRLAQCGRGDTAPPLGPTVKKPGSWSFILGNPVTPHQENGSTLMGEERPWGGELSCPDNPASQTGERGHSRVSRPSPDPTWRQRTARQLPESREEKTCCYFKPLGFGGILRWSNR